VYDPSVARLDCLLGAVEASARRGIDSFGIVRWSASTGFRRYGRTGSGNGDWLDIVGAPDSGEPTIYLHTSRAEPTTEWRSEKSELDIPPFVDQGFGVSHNGIIANDDELAIQYALPRISPIDTAVVPPLIARLGIWPAIAALRGGAALAIIDAAQGVLALCRNFMPLALCWEPGVVCFASESEFFPNAAQPFRSYQVWELPPYTGLELSVKGYRGPVAWGDVPTWHDAAAWRPFPQLSWRKVE
jgi:7-cyano-7-deazaguanine synthase